MYDRLLLKTNPVKTHFSMYDRLLLKTNPWKTHCSMYDRLLLKTNPVKTHFFYYISFTCNKGVMISMSCRGGV